MSVAQSEFHHNFTDKRPRPDWGLFGLNKKFFNAFVESTLLCPNRCPFCMYRDWQPSGTMSFVQLETVLSKLRGKAHTIFLSHAGDSLLLPDLPERVALARKLCPESRVALTTSLSVHRPPEYFQKLAKAGLHYMDISCYAHSQDDYITMHGRDAFAIVKENIKNLRGVQENSALLVNVSFFNDTALHFKIEHAERKKTLFRSFAASHGIKHFLSKEVFTNQGRNELETLDESAQPFPCSIVWGMRAGNLYITWDCHVLPCPYLRSPDMYLGNLLHENLEEIFTSSKFEAFYLTHWDCRHKLNAICKKCNQPNHSASESEFTRLAAYEGARLAGREVYFWGAGEAYRRFASFFSRSKPICILCDSGKVLSDNVDGIPVRHPDAVLPGKAGASIVVFAYPENAAIILKAIREKYPAYSRVPGSVVLCIAQTDIWITEY
jgi:radical SAM protein with 4Fe4S-binding SPASM domain